MEKSNLEFITKKVVESTSKEEKKTCTEEALGAGRQAPAAAPPSCKASRR
jgi:hypothetical protein